MMGDILSNRSPVHQTGGVRPSTLEPEFSASSASLGNLNAITIAELCLGKRYSGRVLHGQFRTEPVISEFVDDIVTILVGMNADAIPVIASKSLWPRSPTGEIEEVFSVGKQAAIKEPLMEMSSNGMYAVRVTNPGEVVFLGDINEDGSSPLESTDAAALKAFEKMDICPAKSSDVISPKELLNVRGEGNRFFRRGTWLAAVNSYSHCINQAFCMLESDGSTITMSKADYIEALMWAYSNRSEAMLRLQHYEDALKDADEALKIKPKINSFIRKGKAAYGLGFYETACQAFRAALDGFVENFIDSLTALKQSRTGEYDRTDYFRKEWRGDERKVIPSCADFLGPEEILRVAYGYGGRLLFATTRIIDCEALLVKNLLAVFHLYSEDGDVESELTAELVKQVRNSWFRMVQLLDLASFVY